MKPDNLFVRFWVNSSFLPDGAMDCNFHRHLQTSEEKLGKIKDQNEFPKNFRLALLHSHLFFLMWLRQHSFRDNLASENLFRFHIRKFVAFCKSTLKKKKGMMRAAVIAYELSIKDSFARVLQDLNLNGGYAYVQICWSARHSTLPRKRPRR